MTPTPSDAQPVVAWLTDIFENLPNGKLVRVFVDVKDSPSGYPDWTPLVLKSALDAERQQREAAEQQVEYKAEASRISREYADHLLARALTAEASLAKANARIAEMKAALRPFAEQADEYDACCGDLAMDDDQTDWPSFQVADFRRARAALTNIEKERDDA